MAGNNLLLLAIIEKLTQLYWPTANEKIGKEVKLMPYCHKLAVHKARKFSKVELFCLLHFCVSVLYCMQLSHVKEQSPFDVLKKSFKR